MFHVSPMDCWLWISDGWFGQTSHIGTFSHSITHYTPTSYLVFKGITRTRNYEIILQDFNIKQVPKYQVVLMEIAQKIFKRYSSISQCPLAVFEKNVSKVCHIQGVRKWRLHRIGLKCHTWLIFFLRYFKKPSMRSSHLLDLIHNISEDYFN